MSKMTTPITPNSKWDLSSWTIFYFSTTFILLIVYYLLTYFTSPLRRYPGPLLAGFTNLWRVYYIRQKKFHLVTEELHKKYGPVVRIGPNVLDVDYPELMKVVFGVKGEWKKTGSVLASSTLVGGKIALNLFSQTDPEIHAKWKRPVAKYYSANAVASLEGHVDRTLNGFLEEIEKRFLKEKGEWSEGVDLGKWLGFYTWDSIGALTFSENLGYLSTGRDFDGTLLTAQKSMDYFCTCYGLPILDRLLDKNPFAVFRKFGPPGFGPIAMRTIKRIMARVEGKDKDFHSADQPDYLDKFLEAKKLNPEVVDDNVLFGYLMNNMVAGSDTTANVLRATIYHGLKDGKRVWNKLSEEVLHKFRAAGNGPVDYKAARGLEYLHAVIKEALRASSPVALGLERYVPKGGVTLPGEHGWFVPEGAILAFNPWVMNHNKMVFGEDADKFRPERWLKGDGETQKQYERRLVMMNNYDFTFGGGSRSCIGKHIAFMQLYKVLATLVLMYDLELLDPEREWQVYNRLFITQEGLEVRMKRRM
ncbi:cytochrome P450 [Podospora fimiseda]|uniref:Cytochrome P450 n=1 Tax=Podospora fimiseda TaxID=252190 RepID=A0AAN6YS22_9PEZI|nr:cytochrome P450 [Podospora fimiseda]